MKKIEFSIGHKSHKLTVIGPVQMVGRYRHYPVRCDCGVEKLVMAFSIGKVKSCGQCKRDPMSDSARRAIGQANKKHGMVKSPEYQAWRKMKSRCERPKDAAYPRYGGRGITVCDRWSSFDNFIADMGERPSAQHSLDRIDNDGGYSPENCQWRTSQEQNCNRRNTVMVEYRGVSVSLPDLCREFGVDYYKTHNRLFRLGWTVDRALTAGDAGLRRK